MNLLLTSEINSIELGYKTETVEEYNEVLSFYSTYLNKVSDINNTLQIYEIDDNFDWINHLQSVLSEKIGKNKLLFKEELLNITTKSNTYAIYIWNNKNENRLRINGILSGKEFKYAKSIFKSLTIKDFELQLLEGKKEYYDTIWATSLENLNSKNINNLNNIDAKKTIKPIVDFIVTTENIKDYCYKNRKTL